MRKLTSREKKIAIACLGMIAVYVVFQLFIRPSKKRDQGLLNAITERRQILEKNTQTLNGTNLIEQKAKTYLETFGQKGSDEEETSVMISDIEAAAGKFKIQITNMQPQKALARDGFKVFGIQIVLNGSLLSITQFVHELQDQPYFFDVSEVQFEKTLGVDDTLHGRISFIKIRFKPTL